MPKISQNQVTIYHSDLSKQFTIVVMYNSEFKFYSKIPSEFHDTVKHLSENQMKKLFMVSRSRKHNSEFSPAVCADSEDDCIIKTKTAYKFLMTMSIEKRDVIIVFYENRDVCSYGDLEHNKEHPQIGLRFGLTYAVETTSGDKKVYNIYDKYEAFGEERIKRREIHIWNQHCTVIPDSPENRIFLESLYEALKGLNQKITSISESEPKLLEFINSNQKMLPQGL